MQSSETVRKGREHKYHCVNPNCKRAFSRPKIIKYYVCPTCQTLVNQTEMAEQAGTQEGVTSAQKPRARKKPLLIKQKFAEHQSTPELTESPELKALDQHPVGDKQEVEEQSTPPETPETSGKSIPPEKVQVQQQKATEKARTQQSGNREEPAVLPSSSECEYGFGYLSQREKGEAIPSTCVECPKSLDCMLAEYNKSRESVKEIKKWYSF